MLVCVRISVREGVFARDGVCACVSVRVFVCVCVRA